MKPADIPEYIERELSAVEPLANVLDDVAKAIPPKAKSFLAGDWLGHPLHPLLTDLPIGFWTTSFVLDLLGGRRTRRTSTAMVGLGVVTAVPTLAAGVVEWSKLPEAKRRVGAVHAFANLAGTFLYLWSFFARVRGRRGRGVALGLLGATAMTVGGFLGGHLTFGEAQDETKDEPTTVEDRPTTNGRVSVTV